MRLKGKWDCSGGVSVFISLGVNRKIVKFFYYFTKTVL